jgi:protein TonB
MHDSNALPDAAVELAIMPNEPRAPHSSACNRKWIAAIAVSCLLHAGVAAAFLMSPAGTLDNRDAEQAEGSDQSGEKVVGSALDKAGSINVALVPDPEPAKSEPKSDKPKQAKPAEPSPSPEPQRQPPTQPLKALPEPVKHQKVSPDILAAEAPRLDNQSVPAVSATPARPVLQAGRTEMPEAISEHPPIPSARPTPTAAPSKAADQKRGTAKGQDRAASAASTGKKQNEAGSAAEDDYRSDVIKKLSSVNRGVPPSVQLAAANNAVVTFVIGSGGAIDELRIVQSSGSPSFDQVVLGIVRKAAPFPPIPPKVGKSLVFTGAIGPF